MRAKPYLAALVAALIVSTGGTAVAAQGDDSAAQQPQASNPAYKVLKLLKYKGPGDAALRVGTYNASTGKGWGWNKVKKKHNITKYSALEYITKGPNRDHQDGTTYRSHAYAAKYRCTDGVCRLVKQYKVFAVVNEKKLGDHHNRGVITAYCDGVVKCPGWVTTALAKANGRSIAGDEQYVSAYKPLAKQLTLAS